MKDEIKEILDRWNKVCNKELLSTDMTLDEMIIFRDYITNLQKEYEIELDENLKLSEWLVQKQKRIEELEKETDYLKDIVSNTELSDEIKKADKWSKRELYKINYQRYQANKRLREENERLKEENKEWSMIFDTFSKRPYAHKYLEEKKKELSNKNIIGLDSEMIYKDYYELKSRNEKAREYLPEIRKACSYELDEKVDNLESILDGDDNN